MAGTRARGSAATRSAGGAWSLETVAIHPLGGDVVVPLAPLGEQHPQRRADERGCAPAASPRARSTRSGTGLWQSKVTGRGPRRGSTRHAVRPRARRRDGPCRSRAGRTTRPGVRIERQQRPERCARVGRRRCRNEVWIVRSANRPLGAALVVDGGEDVGGRGQRSQDGREHPARRRAGRGRKSWIQCDTVGGHQRASCKKSPRPQRRHVG